MPAGGSDGDALIPLRKLGWNAWVSIPIWRRSRRAEGGDILLAERLVGRCQLVESIQFASIGLEQTYVRHRARDGLLRLLFACARTLLFFSCFLRELAHVKTHSAARQPGLALFSLAETRAQTATVRTSGERTSGGSIITVPVVSW
jgi:hypothetical protein